MATRTRAMLALLAAALPSVWLGCNAILGNDEASFVPEGGASPGDDGPTHDSPSGDDGPAPNDGGRDADADVVTCDADFVNDPQNCGACAHDCLGGGCEGGTCGAVLLVSESSSITSASVDGTHVYWVNGKAEIHRAPLVGGDGGLGDTLYTQPAPGFVQGVVSTGTDIYFAASDLIDAGGAIARCPAAGCIDTPDRIADIEGPAGLTIGAGALFWTDETGDGGVGSCTLPVCGSPTMIATQQRFPDGIIVDGTEVFWSSPIAGFVRAAPTGGGTVRSLTETLSSAYGVAVSTDKVYTATLGMGIEVMPRAGGAPALFSTSASQAHDVAADSSFVYFGDYGNGTIYRCPRDGCTSLVVLGTTTGSPKIVFLDSKSLFWVDDNFGGTPAIWRVAR